MSYQLKVIKDYPIGFWPLDESSGSTAADISGCGNNGTYVGSPAANMLPLVPGGISGTRITNTAYATFLNVSNAIFRLDDMPNTFLVFHKNKCAKISILAR